MLWPVQTALRCDASLYLWLEDLALNTDDILVHWTGVHGGFTEAFVLQDPQTSVKKQTTRRRKNKHRYVVVRIYTINIDA